MKLFTSIFSLVAFSSCALSQPQNPMLGRWENVSNGDTVGIALYEGGKCDIYIERAFQTRSSKPCKYEAFEQQYVVYLVKSDGACGFTPDFEFNYQPDAPLIRLFIQGTGIDLSKAIAQSQ